MKSVGPDHAQRVMLLRALSKLGICSRQLAKRAIHNGRVAVNGKVITSHTHWVNLQHDEIALDEQTVRGAEKLVYLMLNKPAGYVTTRRDNLNRPTVFELLAAGEISHTAVSRTASWVFPVGRLDYNSEGLLLFTNDGGLSDALTSPERHVPKVYRVRLDHPPAPADLRRLETGIRILDYVTLPASIEIETTARDAALNENQTNAAGPWLRITIREGKNRQVRRMFAAIGCEVRQLIRVRFGPLALGGLPVGHWRYLTKPEIMSLNRAVEF